MDTLPGRVSSRVPAFLFASWLAACMATGDRETGRADDELQRFEFARPAMGTLFRVLLYAPDEACAAAAAEAAFARIAALDRVLSDYDPESELVRLGARSDEAAPTPPITLSPELFFVLAAAQGFARASAGAFDVTVGPHVRLWRRARRQGELPSAERLAAAARAVGFEKLALEPHKQSARLLARGMRLDLGGIAKGYALDQALAELSGRALPRALVVGGGEMRAGAAPPGESGWRVELVGFETAIGSEPRAILWLAHAALATSGDFEQYLELGGSRYSHILDPRTGAPLTERRLVSVLAPDGLTADALATALSVLGPGPGLALAARFPGVAARLLVLGEGGAEEFRSAGFPPLSCADPCAPPSP